MANPANITIPQGQWTLVAAGVVTGQIWDKTKATDYLYTYVVADDPAPTGTSIGVRVLIGDDDNLPISAAESIDVYLYAVNKAGEVEVHI